jgi:type I restriction enzyme, R subunit
MVSPPNPEQVARQKIDAGLAESGWAVQDRAAMNLYAGRVVAVREYPLAAGYAFADYILFVDGKPVGLLEAKHEGHTLICVERSARIYADGLPANVAPPEHRLG